MQIEPLFGPSPLKMTCTGDGSLRVAGAHAKYMDAVLRGNVYIAGQTTPTVIANGLSSAPTTTTLYNPLGSGVIGFVWYASVTNVVLSAAASMLWIASNIGGAATTGTAGLVTNALTGSVTGGKVVPFTTATLPAAPTNVVMALGALTHGAITTLPQVPPLGGWIDGVIAISPGNALSFQGSTASAAVSAYGLWIYEEVTLNM
jgi:hypothetical protein